jgi:hypothetical protein
MLFDHFFSRALLTQVKDVFAVSGSFAQGATVLEGIMAQTTMAYLEQRYTALEREIANALHNRPIDDLAIADLKCRKLIIADEIQHNRRLVERFPF